MLVLGSGTRRTCLQRGLAQPHTCVQSAQSLLHGMKLAGAAGAAWLVTNGAAAAWNCFLPLLQRQRYADLAGLLVPLLRQLLQVRACLAAAGIAAPLLCCPEPRLTHAMLLLLLRVQLPGPADANTCITLAEAAAKAGEHVALLHALQLLQQEAGAASDAAAATTSPWCMRPGALAAYKPLLAARTQTGETPAAARHLHACLQFSSKRR